ncbi:MAG: hypothetical protein KDA80_18055 [Planctomycetaceae bacterium]|nr:hypothetical protein [Planctomycetaceae bacterium]
MYRLLSAFAIVLTFAGAVPQIALGQSATMEFSVTAPPENLKADPYYEKYVSVDGYPILAAGSVNDYALKEAAFLINQMLVERPDVRRAMINGGSRLLIIPWNEFTTDIPEYSQMKPKDYWDARARGLGGSRTDPYCSCGEENLLCYPGDPYSTENILIHEFAHNIHLRGMVVVDPTFDERLEDTYNDAMKNGLWEGAYASTNHHEYFAEGVQSWFNNNRENDHDHNHVNTRKELLEYDPGLAKICEEVFGETALEYTKPHTRLTGHLAGYRPELAPTFTWPDRLLATKQEIREKAMKRAELAQEQRENVLEWQNAASSGIPNSITRSQQSTTLLFENQSKEPVKLWWQDDQGKTHEYRELRPKSEFRQQTYSGHVWVVKSLDGDVLGYFIASEKPATAVIPSKSAD